MIFFQCIDEPLRNGTEPGSQERNRTEFPIASIDRLGVTEDGDVRSAGVRSADVKCLHIYMDS